MHYLKIDLHLLESPDSGFASSLATKNPGNLAGAITTQSSATSPAKSNRINFWMGETFHTLVGLTKKPSCRRLAA
jgi:hypothetical protein